jgi:hypothetical protein
MGRESRNYALVPIYALIGIAPSDELEGMIAGHAGIPQSPVEHVHVHQGGQAIVGNVETPGGGSAPKSEEQPHALAYAPGTTMPSTDTPRDLVPVAGNEERSMPDARGKFAGSAKGQ